MIFNGAWSSRRPWMHVNRLIKPAETEPEAKITCVLPGGC